MSESPAVPASDYERQFLLSRLRTASLQMRLYDNELVSVGVALRGGAISPEQALAWLDELGATPLIDAVAV